MEWRSVVGWPHYEVSSDGQLRAVNGRAVGQWPNDQGYMMVRLSGPRRMRRIHRLVAEAFIENPNKLPDINHLNNVRSDNRAENLELCTQLQNLTHARRQGRMYKHPRGKRSPIAALTDEQVRQMRQLYRCGDLSYEAIGANFGVSKHAAMKAIKGQTYADVR